MTKTSEVYSRLYHYTTRQGLKGILESQSLWAKNYKYLNDEKEIVLFKDEILPDLLLPETTQSYIKIIQEYEDIRDNFFQSRKNFDEVCRHDCNAFIESMFNALENTIYICSFSGESTDDKINKNGLLSQWRAYGKEESYCLVFDTKKLEDLNSEEYKHCSHMFLGLGDVIYSDNENGYKKEFEEQIHKLCNSVRDFSFLFGTGQDLKKQEQVPYKEFVDSITRYKHFGFKEENEVRIVSHLPPASYTPDKKRKQKDIKSNPPYISLYSDLKTPLPITEIIVGPDKDKHARAAELKEHPTIKNLNIKISVSEIPFKGLRV